MRGGLRLGGGKLAEACFWPRNVVGGSSWNGFGSRSEEILAAGAGEEAAYPTPWCQVAEKYRHDQDTVLDLAEVRAHLLFDLKSGVAPDQPSVPFPTPTHLRFLESEARSAVTLAAAFPSLQASASNSRQPTHGQPAVSRRAATSYAEPVDRPTRRIRPLGLDRRTSTEGPGMDSPTRGAEASAQLTGQAASPDS